MTSASLIHETGHPKLVHWDDQRDGIGKEVGGGFRMGNTCTLMADSCQCMAKPIQSCKVKTNKQQQQQNTLEGINIRIYEAEE